MLWKQHKFRLSEKKIINIFGQKREEVTRNREKYTIIAPYFSLLN
jgi:hypothetical protein